MRYCENDKMIRGPHKAECAGCGSARGKIRYRRKFYCARCYVEVRDKHEGGQLEK